MAEQLTATVKLEAGMQFDAEDPVGAIDEWPIGQSVSTDRRNDKR